VDKTALNIASCFHAPWGTETWQTCRYVYRIKQRIVDSRHYNGHIRRERIKKNFTVQKSGPECEDRFKGNTLPFPSKLPRLADGFGPKGD